MKKTIIVTLAAAAILSVGASAQNVSPRTSHFDVMEATITEIHAAMLGGRLTAHELVKEYLDRIAAFDKKGPDINCVVTLNPNALGDADKLDSELKATHKLSGSLHGIPVLIKDEIDAAGMPTTLGSVVFKDYRPTRDASTVAALRREGAIILGKASLSEFLGGDTYGSGLAERGEPFGVTRNPYDTRRTVGGSSGGSAACLAANFATLSIGEETVASLRRPGAWNDVVALRPTAGLISRAGMYDGWPDEVAEIGPLARTVADLARLMDVLVGYDPEDPQTALGVGHKPDSYVAGLIPSALKGVRIGVLRTDLSLSSDPTSEDYRQIVAGFDVSIRELKTAGAVVVDPIVIPNLMELLGKRATLPSMAEAGLEAWLARNPNSPFHTRNDIVKSPDLNRAFPPRNYELFALPQQPDDTKKYGEYLIARRQLLINILKVMADNRLDAIVYRTIEHSPPLTSEGTRPPYPYSKGVPTLNTFLVYVPAITVPSGFTRDNLPTGITFMGRPFDDAKIIQFAFTYEQATHHRIPPAFTPPLAKTDN